EVLHRGRVEAALAEAAPGRLQDLPAAGVAVLLGHAGHGGQRKRNVPSWQPGGAGARAGPAARGTRHPGTGAERRRARAGDRPRAGPSAPPGPGHPVELPADGPGHEVEVVDVGVVAGGMAADVAEQGRVLA